MSPIEWTWNDADRIPIFTRLWTLEQPRGVIVLVHGMGEHSLRYEHVAGFLNNKGLAVMAFDLRGHGRSGGKRGHIPSIDDFYDEIGKIVAEAEIRFPEIPLFLYGHSMGGGLVLGYALRRHPEISGVIATSPWIQLAFQPAALMILLGRLTRSLAPSLSQPSRLKAEYLSHDPAVVKAYLADPLVHDRITSATGIGMLELGNWLNTYNGVFPLPLLLMHGVDDHITSPKATAAFAERINGDITVKLWQDGYHEMHNEPNKQDVLTFIGDWLEKHLEPIKTA